MNELILAVLFAAIVALSVCLWKSLSVLADLSGARNRADAQERKDSFDLIQRMAEKATTFHAAQLSAMHAKERQHRTMVDANTDRRVAEIEHGQSRQMPAASPVAAVYDEPDDG